MFGCKCVCNALCFLYACSVCVFVLRGLCLVVCALFDYMLVFCVVLCCVCFILRGDGLCCLFVIFVVDLCVCVFLLFVLMCDCCTFVICFFVRVFRCVICLSCLVYVL